MPIPEILKKQPPREEEEDEEPVGEEPVPNAADFEDPGDDPDWPIDLDDPGDDPDWPEENPEKSREASLHNVDPEDEEEPFDGVPSAEEILARAHPLKSAKMYEKAWKNFLEFLNSPHYAAVAEGAAEGELSVMFYLK